MKHLYSLCILLCLSVSFVTAAQDEPQPDETVITADSIAAMAEETATAEAEVPIAAMAEVPVVPDTVKIDEKRPDDMANYYRIYRGVDFRFLKNTTNPAVKPYKFMQDQTWVGIPVFLAGWIAKGEKEAFRQNYRNPNTKIRLIKYNFHSEIDNYTQFSVIALTAGLKIAAV